MMSCATMAAGDLERYFYGELAAAEREQLERHLAQCAACREALDDLATIRAVLAARHDLDCPPGGDWSQFMRGLESRRRALADAAAHEHPAPPSRVGWPRAGARRVLAAAAALVVVVAALTMVQRAWERVIPDPGGRSGSVDATPGHDGPDPALFAVTDQHFQRSKLVVLGLATRDASAGPEVDWAYERDLAAALLRDTHVYRIAAETRGMTSVAGVMRDLEFVLLEASMTGTPDGAALEHVQSLIRRRDLVAKMNAAQTTAQARVP